MTVAEEEYGGFWFVRIVCAECGVERVIEEQPNDEHGTAWAWPPCPDHPDADSRQICYCGDDETRCAVEECSEGSDVHIAGPMGDTFYGVGLCDTHEEAIRSDPTGHWDFARHYFEVESMEDAEHLVRTPGGG